VKQYRITQTPFDTFNPERIYWEAIINGTASADPTNLQRHLSCLAQTIMTANSLKTNNAAAQIVDSAGITKKAAEQFLEQFAVFLGVAEKNIPTSKKDFLNTLLETTIPNLKDTEHGLIIFELCQAILSLDQKDFFKNLVTQYFQPLVNELKNAIKNAPSQVFAYFVRLQKLCSLILETKKALGKVKFNEEENILNTAHKKLKKTTLLSQSSDDDAAHQVDEWPDQTPMIENLENLGQLIIEKLFKRGQLTESKFLNFIQTEEVKDLIRNIEHFQNQAETARKKSSLSSENKSSESRDASIASALDADEKHMAFQELANLLCGAINEKNSYLEFRAALCKAKLFPKNNSNEAAIGNLKQLKTQFPNEINIVNEAIAQLENSIHIYNECLMVSPRTNQSTLKTLEFYFEYELKTLSSQLINANGLNENEIKSIIAVSYVQSTQARINYVIDNLRDHGEDLKRENAHDKSKDCEELTDELQDFADNFYSNPDEIQANAKKFFQVFQEKIEAKEKDLDIPRKLWKPALANVGLIFVTGGLALFAIAGKSIAYLAGLSSAPLFFMHSDSYKLGEEAIKTAFEISKEISSGKN
jgi:hypothetical protein